MLIERESAVAKLTEVANQLNRGHGNIALVSGEAGIGKTSLLEEIKRTLDLQYKIIWSGCDPLFTPRPFGPLYDFATSFSPKIHQLLETGAPPSTIFSAFYDALESSKEPLILIFEDVHWADYATLDLFRFLGRRISFLKCLMIISFRDDEISDQHPLRLVLDILPSAHTTRINVEPLTEEGVNQLASGYKHDISKLHEITAGNPFFVTELLASDNKLGKSLPASVRDAVNARLIRLTQQERCFLETISVIPNAISQELIENLCGPTGETYAMACVARNFISLDRNGGFHFRHELARLGTLARVSVSEQKKLHSRIIIALEQGKKESDIGSLIHHSAGALDGSRVLKYAPLAAKNAADLGAHQEAASYLATALRFVDEAPTELAAQLYDDWAYETGLALQINDEVIEARRHAITLWRALDRKDKIGENLRWLSRLHWYRGEAAEAGHFSNEAIKVLESIPASSERAMAYSLRSQLYMLNDRMDEAVKWGNRALELEGQHINTEVRIHALNNIGSAMVLRGNEVGETHLLKSLSLSLEHGFHEHAARVYTNMSDYCVRYKKLDLADKFIADGIAYDTQYDLDSWTYYLVGIQAQLRMEQGRLRDAKTIAQGVLELDKLTLLMQLPALTVLARVQLRLADAGYKNTLQQSLDNAFATDEQQYIIPARFCAIESAWLHNYEDVAYEQLKFLSELDQSKLDHWSAGELAIWIRRFGFDLPGNSSLSLPEPFMLELGRKYIDAAEKWLSLGLPYNAALSLMQVDDDLAENALPKAYKILETMDAKVGLSLIRTRAKKIGLLSKLPRTRRGPYKTIRQHPVGLTNKEQEILRFIIEGASNREISIKLSRSQRTVENHVSSILNKLNVQNRLGAMLRIQNEPWLSV